MTFGLLVNPRDGQPYYAEKSGNRTITIYTLDDVEAGEGYFNDESRYSAPSTITGLPRVHTPEGVKKKQTGTGTVLYTGLCLAAHMQYNNDLSLARLDVRGDGISSGRPRSASAERWWEAAAGKYGLAEQIVGCADEEFEDDDIHVSDIDDIVKDALDAKSADVSHYNLSASGTVTKCGLEADAYPFSRATRASLVLATFDDGKLNNWLDVPHGQASIISRKAIASINTGSFRELGNLQDEDEANDIMRSILKLADIADLSRVDKEGLLLRYSAGADEDMSVWKHPDFSYVRENPVSYRGRIGKVAMQKKMPLQPRVKRMPKARVKLYGRVRKNPVDRQVAKEIERLHEMRAELGWEVFAT